MNIFDLYNKYKQTFKVSTDTRSLEKDSVFFALKGDNFNANHFAEKALQLGASYVVIDEKEYYKENERYILVKDVLQSLQELASFHRKKLEIPIIALTGSNGKTTTKELVNVVLSQKYNIVATKGNLNNHIGVPLTLLSMTPDTEICIVEMGANHFGEIKDLCEIAIPDYGYITNFGKAHLEGFGSLDGVIKAKTELYTFLKKSEGIVFYNPNDAVQEQKTKQQKRFKTGINIHQIPSNNFVKTQLNNTNITSKLLGDYNFNNIAAAISIGQYFDVSNEQIKRAIESYTPNNKRSQLITKGKTRIILDAYNANPTSMIAAISSFAKDGIEKKVLILGDMFELGESTKTEHQKIADLATALGFEKIVLIGNIFYEIKNKIVEQFRTYDDFKNSFNKTDYSNTRILIKGSRGMALERIVELF